VARSRALSLTLPPPLATSGALKIWELWAAVPEVIWHRAARLATAGPVPSLQDRQEFQRMGQEKVAAFTESIFAMAAETLRWNFDTAPRLMSSFWHHGSSWPFMLTFPWRRALPPGLSMPAVSATGMTKRAGRVIEKGLAPVHRRATANARRLRRAKRR